MTLLLMEGFSSRWSRLKCLDKSHFCLDNVHIPNNTFLAQMINNVFLKILFFVIGWIVALEVELVILTTRRNKEQRHFD